MIIAFPSNAIPSNSWIPGFFPHPNGTPYQHICNNLVISGTILLINRIYQLSVLSQI